MMSASVGQLGRRSWVPLSHQGMDPDGDLTD